jgi:Protein of unknown function (DUF3313)
MRDHEEIRKLLCGTLPVIAVAALIAGCAQTAAPAPTLVQRIEHEKPAPPPPTGFLGSDYSLLKAGAEGSGQAAMLAYTDANADFTSYNKVMIAPVTFWAEDDSKLSAGEQQTLCNYFDHVLKQELSKNFKVVNEHGPGVAKLAVALTDATSAVPVLRTISVIVPQAHALSLIKQGLTGTYSFVGSATGEGKLTDSVSGQLLGAWVDKRFGTGAVKNATVWKWGDADNAMKYWANTLDERLVKLGVQQTASAPAAKSRKKSRR